MSKKVIKILALPLLAFLTLGANCPLIPQLEERIVELALVHSTAVEFTSVGELNTIDQTETIDIVNDFDLEQILADAGVNVSDCKSIKVAGAAYVTTQPELGVARQIQSGTITFHRAGGSDVVLVSNFTEWVNEVLEYKAAPLNPAGVAEVNALLADILDGLKNNTPANSVVTYHLTGASYPATEMTDFKWKLRLDVSVVGTIKVDVLN